MSAPRLLIRDLTRLTDLSRSEVVEILDRYCVPIFAMDTEPYIHRSEIRTLLLSLLNRTTEA